MKRRHACFSVTKFNLKHIYCGTMNQPKKCVYVFFSLVFFLLFVVACRQNFFNFYYWPGFLANFRLKVTCRLLNSHRRHFILSFYFLIYYYYNKQLPFFGFFRLFILFVFFSFGLSFSLFIFLGVWNVSSFLFDFSSSSHLRALVRYNCLRCFLQNSKRDFSIGFPSIIYI